MAVTGRVAPRQVSLCLDNPPDAQAIAFGEKQLAEQVVGDGARIAFVENP